MVAPVLLYTFSFTDKELLLLLLLLTYRFAAPEHAGKERIDPLTINPRSVPGEGGTEMRQV